MSFATRQERVVDLFHAWDSNRDGHVDKSDFVRALHGIGIDTGKKNKKNIEDLFNVFDLDASGTIDYEET